MRSTITLIALSCAVLAGCADDPVATISTPETATVGATVVLDGAGSAGTEETPLIYEWDVIGRPAGAFARLNDANVVAPTIVPDAPGEYRVSLVVHEGERSSEPAFAGFTVVACGTATPEVAEVIVAPGEPAIGSQVRFEVITLDLDNDPEGCGLQQVLDVSSAFVDRPAGTSAVLNPAEGSSPAFVADVAGTYVVRTAVTDETERSSAIDTTVEVSDCGGAAPTVAGVTVSPASPVTGDLVALGVSFMDADNDPEGCALTQVVDLTSSLVGAPAGSSASMVPSRGATPGFFADLPGEYVVRTTALDDTGRASSADTVVTVSTCGSAPPAISGVATSPASPGVGQLVSLTVGFGDADNTGCALGQALDLTSVFLQRPAGSGTEFSPPEGPSPGFVPDVPGTYVVRTTVVDDTGLTGSLETTVVASSCGSAPPSLTVVAPPQPNIGDLANLAATATDADNAGACGLDQVLSIGTVFVQRPAGSAVVLAPPEGTSPAFIPDVPGTYVLRTVAEDDTGRSSMVDTTVIASSCGGAIPSITNVLVSPNNPETEDEVELTVSFFDADNLGGCGLGQTLTLNSEFVVLPPFHDTELEPAVGPTPAFEPKEEGAHVVRTTVTDDTGRSSFVDTTIVVD